MRFLIALAFLLTIPAANWMIGNVGTACPAGGPCLLPVWPGILAPSGVLMAGLALVLRDGVQALLGVRWSILLILAGGALSGLLAPGALILASTVAFLLSELVDLWVYTPLRERGLYAAVGLSSLAGAVVDSLLFLGLAFGSMEFLPGQVIGKLWALALAFPVLWWLRKRELFFPGQQG